MIPSFAIFSNVPVSIPSSFSSLLGGIEQSWLDFDNSRYILLNNEKYSNN
jgi:hypothetical protein